MIVFEYLFTYTTPQYHTFQGTYQSRQWNVCAAYTSVTFPVIWSNIIDFSDLSGDTVRWSRFSV